MGCIEREALEDLVDGDLDECATARAIQRIRSCNKCKRDLSEILALYVSAGKWKQSCMLKRNPGPTLQARSYHSQTREIRLPGLTHDLGILWRQPCQWLFHIQ